MVNKYERELSFGQFLQKEMEGIEEILIKSYISNIYREIQNTGYKMQNSLQMK